MFPKKSLRETNVDGITYVCPTWNQMGEATFFLAKKIIDSGREFDRVVALAKGGWTWARTLVDYLKINNLSTTRLKSYDGVNQNDRVKVLQPLADFVDGERILVFDDVADSGKTIVRAKKYMEILGSKEVAVATLCFKPRSCVMPDFFAFSTEAWVVFPHEYREFIDQSQKRWAENKISNIEIRSRFEKIGLPMDQVDYFLKQL